MLNNLPFYLFLLLRFVQFASSYDSLTGCKPFGLRLALGSSFYLPASNQHISIWFNTKQYCPKSFATIQKDLSITKVYCNTKNVSFSDYASFVHKCSVDFLKRGDSYKYQAFGWTGQYSDPGIPFKNQNTPAHLIHHSDQIKVLSLADWGFLDTKSQIYDRLDTAFEYISNSKNKPDIIYMGGDYAYDLSSNNGKNYQDFLTMLSTIASQWPCIMTTGNHQYKKAEDFYIFNLTFQVYNLTRNNISMLNLQLFTILTIDPYNILYQNGKKSVLFNQLRNNLKLANPTKPIIVTSHYPLACSSYSNFCKNLRQQLQQFWNLMIDYNVVLYIGAHVHTYERLYPFMKTGTFIQIEEPYNLNRQTKMLISVVEGIAGNDQGIIQSYSDISNCTAALSYNKTGYGLLTINPKELMYEHYESKNPIKAVDSLTVRFHQLFEEKKGNLRQD